VIRLSKASYRKTIQNLAWAAGYNVVAIPLAAGVLAWPGFTLLRQHVHHAGRCIVATAIAWSVGLG
jgi:cation transport ATPase